MDPYLFSLLLGGAGLGAMAASGLVRGGHGHGDGHGGHDGHAGPGHAVGHGGHGHVGGHAGGHGFSLGHGHATDFGMDGGDAAQAGGDHSGDADDHGEQQGAGSPIATALLTLASPRVLFSLALGFGTAGLVLAGVLGGPLRALAAVLGAIAFERLLVTPIWNLGFKFESKPAFTLESAVTGEATAVTGFDARGHGLIQIELDGQVVQVLGTLQRTDRELGVRVKPGARLRVEDVDTARNSCTVSLL